MDAINGRMDTETGDRGIRGRMKIGRIVNTATTFFYIVFLL